MNRNDFIERAANLATMLAKLPEDAGIISAEISTCVSDSIHLEHETFCKYLQGKKVTQKTGDSCYHFAFEDAHGIRITAIKHKKDSEKEKREIVLPMID